MSSTQLRLRDFHPRLVRKREIAVDRPWDYTPVSRHLFGDTGPWTWEVPRLWRLLADSEGPNQPPAAPWRRNERDDRADQIAFWLPLLTLTYSVLGWPRPDVGIRRWMDAGRPIEDSALALIDRWWGGDALALVAWNQRSGRVDHFGKVIASGTASNLGRRSILPPVGPETRWEHVGTGGSDPLRLGHVVDHLLGSADFGGQASSQTGRLIHDPPTGPDRDAGLETYAGWYATLARLGAELPQRPDGHSRRVHVTVAPLGYLDTYRWSRVTGRWFAGQHHWHLRGWTE
jgi:hypothetical protein